MMKTVITATAVLLISGVVNAAVTKPVSRSAAKPAASQAAKPVDKFASKGPINTVDIVDFNDTSLEISGPVAEKIYRSLTGTQQIMHTAADRDVIWTSVEGKGVFCERFVTPSEASYSCDLLIEADGSVRAGQGVQQ